MWTTRDKACLGMDRYAIVRSLEPDCDYGLIRDCLLCLLNGCAARVSLLGRCTPPRATLKLKPGPAVKPTARMWPCRRRSKLVSSAPGLRTPAEGKVRHSSSSKRGLKIAGGERWPRRALPVFPLQVLRNRASNMSDSLSFDTNALNRLSTRQSW